MHKLKTLKALALILVLAALGTGCASYSCGAPGGLSCSSLEDTYNAREAGKLKHQQTKHSTSTNDNSSNVRHIGKPSTNHVDKFQDDPQSGRHLQNNEKASAVAKLNQQISQSKLAKLDVTNVAPSSPILSRPEVLRVYIARHEADEDFHDEQFVYLRLDAGKWLLLDN